jgi:hypothetical protein
MGLRTDVQQVVQETSVVLGADSTSPEGMKAIPQIQATLEYIGENPIESTRLYLEYRRLVYCMLNLNNYDLEIIDSAHERYEYKKRRSGQNSDSASKLTTREVLDLLGEVRLEVVTRFVDSNPEDIVLALNPLFEMMSNASLALHNNPNFVPKDGDPISDKIIWGHTQIESNNPRVLLHFIIAHGIERYIVTNFGINVPKDSILNALTDTLSLQYARRKANPEIVETWCNPKKSDDPKVDTGLGWLSSKRLESFENALMEC